MKQTQNHKEKHHKKLRVLFFFCLSLLLVSAQQPSTTDTAKYFDPEEIPTEAQKQLIDSLTKSANDNLRKGQFSKALLAAQNSLELSRSLRDYDLIGNCLNKIATVHYYQGEYFDALFYFDESISAYKQAGNIKGMASATNNKGAIYYYLGNLLKALEHYKGALMLSETLADKENSVASIRNNMAGIYVKLGDYENAMSHFQMAKSTYDRIGDRKKLSQVINGIGEIYLKKHQYQEARSYFDQALHLAKQIDDQQRILEALLSLGEIEEHQGNLKEALSLYDQSLDLSQQINNPLYRAKAQIALGSVSLKRGAIAQAIAHCQDGLDGGEHLKSITVQKQACDCLYDAYKSSGMNSSALVYLEKSIALKDSLHAKQTADAVLQMQFEKQLLLDSMAHVEEQKKLELSHQEDIRKKEKQRNIFIIIGVFLILLAVAIWSRLNYVRKSKLTLQKEKDRSEHLLLNILPEDIAEELKEKGYVNAQNFESAAILFTDFKSFTETASRLSPEDLVQELNICFKAFDIILDQYRIEKIKTIGDAYMAAGGVPRADANAVKNTILTALDMQDFMMRRKAQNMATSRPSFDMRVGIHVGPIVAGIVGVKKFQYDIWGDTVNTASRMESNGEIGKVNISQATYLLVQNESDLTFDFRGRIQAKGKGEVEMYFVAKRAPEALQPIEEMQMAST